jgi:hypothetical protein
LNGFAGPVGTIATSGLYQFVGPTVTVTLTAGQQLVGSAQAPLGGNTGDPAAFPFFYGLCSQSLSIPIPFNFVGGNHSEGIKSPEKRSYTASATVSLPAGQHRVGFCVQNPVGVAMDNNGNVSGWVMVVN